MEWLQSLNKFKMKTIIKGITSVLSFLMCYTLNAQQVPQFSQLLQNRYILNPASTGESVEHNAVVGFRKQWVGLNNSPSTYYIGYNKGFVKSTESEHQPLAIRTARVEDYDFKQTEGGVSKLKHGIGAYVVGDNYGPFQNMNLNLSYALHMPMNDKINISFGANTRFHNSKFDASKALTETNGDPTYDAFVSERNGLTSLEIDLGTYLYGENFFVGYSTNQLTGDRIAFGDVSNNILVTHHALMAGYTFELNDKIDLTPSSILRAVKGAPLSIDLLINSEINDMIIAGIGYRHKDAIAILTGIKLDEKYRIGYSYDINTSGLSSYNSGSHEITLGIIF